VRLAYERSLETRQAASLRKLNHNLSDANLVLAQGGFFAMHIAFAASECVPFSKTGGLADVVGALPRALASLGHQVSVYVPRYRQTKLTDPQTVVRSITIPFDDKYRFCSVVTAGSSGGVRFYFVDYPPYFDREALYGGPAGDYPDNAERFALFSRAVLEASKVLGVPHVFHCHDWQSALVPVMLRTLYAEDPAFREVATVFTIHNMGYQGLFPPDTLPLLTLPWDLFTISKMEFFGQVNFLKGALVLSDFVTTVSKKYSQEIQTTEYGFGLEGVLRNRAATVTGILNGVDYDEWSPETDKFIVAKYSPQDLSGKLQCKKDLLNVFGITNADANSKVPVIGIVSRFAAQKGFDLIAQIMDRLAREEMIMVVLGSGDKLFEDMFRRLNKQFPNKIAAKVAFDNAIAHKIEAGADMFLMPSRYEPCGLNQIYSLKYGTVPIVRATGGLDDTIEPWDARTGKGTGFKFSDYTGEALLATIKQALLAYRDPSSWQTLMRNGMSRDFSWGASAREYGKVYERARQVRASADAVAAADLKKEPVLG
jgi:starch synthase